MPLAVESLQKGVPHSVSASPPQMSLTRTSRRPVSARTRAKSRLDLRLDRVVGADRDAPAPLGRDQLRRLLQRLRPPRGRGPVPHAAARAVDGGARSAQHAGDAAARAPRRTGNNGHLISKRTARHATSFDIENQNDDRRQAR